MEREFFTGFIKIYILFHAAAGEICGTEIAEELARHGYDVTPAGKRALEAARKRIRQLWREVMEDA
jgi:hypothetical protein